MIILINLCLESTAEIDRLRISHPENMGDIFHLFLLELIYINILYNYLNDINFFS